MIKEPTVDKWRNIQLTNSLIKQVVELDKPACEKFLSGIGFEKISETAFKFGGCNLTIVETV